MEKLNNRVVLACLSIVIVVAITMSCQRPRLASTILGEESAREALHKVLNDSTHELRYVEKIISDEDTAVKLAEIVLFKIYGEGKILDEKPYEVYNLEGYWIVRGTIPLGYDGGAFQIILDEKDGRVVHVTHFK